MSKFNNGDVTDVLDSFFIDYAIDDDVDEVSAQELMQQRSDMNKAVNEWYTKAEAFDEIVEQYEEIMKEARNRKFKVTSDVTLLGLKVEKVIKKYESGERVE